VGGKAVVRFNAVKHGLLSKEIVIEAGDGKEDAAEFEALFGRLQSQLEPEGPLEEMLVERIAICYWRLRRILRCEKGEIRKGLDSARFQEIADRADAIGFYKKYVASETSRRSLREDSLGLDYLIGVLDDVRSEVDELGYLSQGSLTRLAQHFGADQNGLTCWCLVFSKVSTEGPEKLGVDPDQFGEVPTPEKCKEAILQLLDGERSRLEELKQVVEEKEHLETEANVASLALPSKEAADKILRYETTIERQLYRAIDHLQRLQRHRRGESVLPPKDIDSTAEN
jgi:hypothetical protein